VFVVNRNLVIAAVVYLMANHSFSAEVENGNKKYIHGDLDGALSDYNKAIALNASRAEAYIGRGNVRQAKGDWDGAITDFTKAIALKPNMADPYFNRANARKAKGDLQGAVADFTKAIELDPKAVDAYHNRGSTKRDLDDIDGALADFDKMIALDPEVIVSYASRAEARRAKGDLRGALADSTKLIALAPKDPRGYITRGWLYYQNHAFTNALLDFQKGRDLDLTNAYVHVATWMSRARLGETAVATKELQSYIDHRGTKGQNEWVSKVARFLAGQLTEAEIFISVANDDKEIENGQRCEAYFYVGTKRLIGGDKTAARKNFEKCVETSAKSFDEYQGALAELKFLNGEKP
jgi:tetratricopeptide (TPR) repeat protein